MKWKRKKGFKGALKSAAESLTEKSCVEIFPTTAAWWTGAAALSNTAPT